MLTANVPFTGDTDFEVMQAHMQTPPPLPTRFYPYIPKGIENAVLQAIEKDQAARFQTVEEFGAALEHPENYRAPAPGAVAAGPPLAGATRLEGVTQTILPPPPSNPGVTSSIPPPRLTPPPPPPTPPPPPVAKPSLLASRNAKLAAAGCAVAVVALVAVLARPKPQPQPAPPTGGYSSPVTSSQPQGQVEVPVPMPPPSDTPPPQQQPPQQQQPQRQPQAQPQPQQPPDKKKTQQAASVQPPPAPAPAPAVATAATPSPAPPAPIVPPPPVAAVGSPVTIPAGTRITIRTIGMASTRSNKAGDPVAAAVDAPVAIAGRTAIPRGADATLRIASLDEGIVLDLAGISVGGRQYQASADSYSPQGASKERKGNKVVGVFRHLDPVKKRGSQEQAAVIAPGSRITFTLRNALEIVAP